jgi:ABC-type branched-subunit amino acid transport system substrate-binding protein
MPLRGVSEPLRAIKGFSRSLSLATARSGDTLNLGRYRLVSQLVLPDNQQGQGVAWLAIDTAAGQTQVVIREVAVPPEESARKKQIVRQVALRLSEGTQHAGFPKVLDVFDEADHYFIVLQHIEGESLASLLRRQGGALSERTVAEYGRQLCEMLAVLARQQPPLVHGAINPETVIVSPDRARVHLIHLPLFPPKEPPNASIAVGYKAPEQARSAADPASDLYSVAATMHHAVTGFDPRERVAFFYPPVRRLNPLVTQQMETILAQELRLSAPQRYARPSDMQADLASLLATKLLEPERKPSIVPESDPMKLDIEELRKRGRERNRTQLTIFSVICFLVLLIAVFAYLLNFMRQTGGVTASAPTPNATATMISQRSALDDEWKSEAPQYQSKGIGLSDGRYVFDTFAGRLPAEINYKKQAAQALLQGNIAEASNDYGEAVTNDKTDAEARIYYADLQIQEQNEKYITIVLGVPLDGSALHLSLARPDLQAAFAFQNEINTQNPSPLPGGAKLRILIGNSGANNSDAATIAQFVANRVTKTGNADNIVAVVGWPTSGESSNAISILAGAHIPVVTQTASSTALNGISPYFFRVNPNDTAQGQAQGQFAYQTLGARTVLVLRDPNDSYSQSLADAFTSSFKQMGGKVIGSQADYFTEGQTTVTQFKQQIVHDALINHVDLIFLPGFDVDGVRLAHALGLEEQQDGWSAYLARLRILGGDGLDTGLILGNGDGADATIARGFPEDMRRLIFTSFADQSEWDPARPPAFLTTWENLYGVASASNPNPPVPINSAIMVGDAFGVVAYALEHVNGAITGENLRTTLAIIGTGNIGAYQGLSGPISFGSDGNPVNKAVVLLEVVAGSNGQNVLKFLGTSGKAH